MDIEELARIRDHEREKDSLQHLPEDFYTRVGAYLEELRQRRDAAAADADDPFRDPEVRELSDELDTAERIVEAVYERRVGKIVKLASFEAADMATEAEGLTAEERELCDDIVASIRDNRERVLATLAKGEETDHQDAVEADPPEDIDRGGESAEIESDTEEEEDTEAIERTTVRITQDLGEIVGIDERTYHLAADDIVTLPAKNAEPLVSRGAAELVE